MEKQTLTRAAKRAARAWRRVRGITDDPSDYGRWIRHFDTPDARELAALAAWVDGLPRAPLVSLIVVRAGADDRALERTRRSIQAQIYPASEIVIVDRDAGALRTAFERAGGEYLAVLDAGDRLPPHALAAVVRVFSEQPDTALVYSDEDAAAVDGTREAPRFKPDLDMDLLRATPYLGRLTVFRATAAWDAGGLTDAPGALAEYDLALRVIERTGPETVRHIPCVLCTRDRAADAVHDARVIHGRLAVVRAHLTRIGAAATATIEAAEPPVVRVDYALPVSPPRVSVIVPTRNQHRRLAACVESLLTRTRYPYVDLLVIDNGGDDPAALAYLDGLRRGGRVLVRRDDRPFNWAALNNTAAAVTSGEVLCFLNDDVEALTPEWLDIMVAHALRREVGAVGARLWFPDRTLQHGGLVLHPETGATHLHQGLRPGESGYLGRAAITQHLSAVTGACLVVRRSVFVEAGGFDEAFPVDFNDVDFCLRLIERGYRNVWTPYAELTHHQAATRGPYERPDARARFERARRMFIARWGDRVEHDPAFNPNLSLAGGPLPLAWPPRVPRQPWRQSDHR